MDIYTSPMICFLSTRTKMPCCLGRTMGQVHCLRLAMLCPQHKTREAVLSDSNSQTERCLTTLVRLPRDILIVPEQPLCRQSLTMRELSCSSGTAVEEQVYRGIALSCLLLHKNNGSRARRSRGQRPLFVDTTILSLSHPFPTSLLIEYIYPLPFHPSFSEGRITQMPPI